MLLGIYPKDRKTLIQRDTCSPMLISELFIIAKLWKQPKYLSVDEWIDVVYIDNRILFSHKKRMNSICNNMDGSREYNAQQNKPVRERQILYDFTHMWNLRNKTNEQRKKETKQKNRLLNIENKLVTARREVGEGMGEKGEGD